MFCFSKLSEADVGGDGMGNELISSNWRGKVLRIIDSNFTASGKMSTFPHAWGTLCFHKNWYQAEVISSYEVQENAPIVSHKALTVADSLKKKNLILEETIIFLCVVLLLAKLFLSVPSFFAMSSIFRADPYESSLSGKAGSPDSFSRTTQKADII